jgi:hypothetical protein
MDYRLPVDVDVSGSELLVAADVWQHAWVESARLQRTVKALYSIASSASSRHPAHDGKSTAWRLRTQGFQALLPYGHVRSTNEFSRPGAIKKVNQARSLSDICFEVGVNVFDTTSRHSEGRSEEVHAMALKGELAKPSFYGFTVSPDERSLIYSQFDRTGRSTLLARNFR